MKNQPFHFLAEFPTGDDFLCHFMYHVPSGGVFLFLPREKSHSLLGHIAEVRLIIQKPQINLFFRGVVTYCDPLSKNSLQSRIGIEFFRYENGQKNFLLDLLNEDLDSVKSHAHYFRKAKRFPLHLRLRFQCLAQGKRTLSQKSKMMVTTLTQDLSLKGCSFHSIRFVETGTPLTISLLLPKSKNVSDLTYDIPQEPYDTEAFPFPAIVRWQDPQNFQKRMMGLEFNFENSQTIKSKKKLEKMLENTQRQMEDELLTRRNFPAL